MNLPERVIYSQTDAPTNFMVERYVPYDLSTGDARQVLGVLSAVHTAKLEDPLRSNPLPAGTVAAHYSPKHPDDKDAVAAVVAAQLHKMENDCRNGSEYWWAHEGFHDSSVRAPILGFIKVSPSRATIMQKAGLHLPNMFVNDILAVEPGKGVGSMLMYTAARFGGFKSDGPVALDAYDDTEARGWLYGLGFRDVEGAVVLPAAFGEHRVAQYRMSTEGVTTLAGLASVLSNRLPQLAAARAV